MKLKSIVILSGILLFISCMTQEEEKDSSCFTSKLEKINSMYQEYKDEIAAIRNPDGSYYTYEQCAAQKEVAEEYLEEFKTYQEDHLLEGAGACSEAEINEIQNRVEGIIAELDWDVNVQYTCEP